MDEYVYDSIGNAHERKNLYLKDLAKGVKVDKSTHPYLKELNSFKEKEKAFLLELKSEVNKKKQEYKGTCDKKETKLRIELMESKKEDRIL